MKYKEESLGNLPLILCCNYLLNFNLSSRTVPVIHIELSVKFWVDHNLCNNCQLVYGCLCILLEFHIRIHPISHHYLLLYIQHWECYYLDLIHLCQILTLWVIISNAFFRTRFRIIIFNNILLSFFNILILIFIFITIKFLIIFITFIRPFIEELILIISIYIFTFSYFPIHFWRMLSIFFIMIV